MNTQQVAIEELAGRNVEGLQEIKKTIAESRLIEGDDIGGYLFLRDAHPSFYSVGTLRPQDRPAKTWPRSKPVGNFHC